MTKIIHPQDATAENIKELSISELALLISRSWPKINYAAVPYVDAMYRIESINDMYFADSAFTIVLYFLNNAQTYRGDVAKLVKAELKARCKQYEKTHK